MKLAKSLKIQVKINSLNQNKKLHNNDISFILSLSVVCTLSLSVVYTLNSLLTKLINYCNKTTLKVLNKYI